MNSQYCSLKNIKHVIEEFNGKKQIVYVKEWQQYLFFSNQVFAKDLIYTMRGIILLIDEKDCFELFNEDWVLSIFNNEFSYSIYRRDIGHHEIKQENLVPKTISIKYNNLTKIRVNKEIGIEDFIKYKIEDLKNRNQKLLYSVYLRLYLEIKNLRLQSGDEQALYSEYFLDSMINFCYEFECNNLMPPLELYPYFNGIVRKFKNREKTKKLESIYYCMEKISMNYDSHSIFLSDNYFQHKS